MYDEPNKENDEKVMSKPENLKVWSPVKKKNHFNTFSYVASKKNLTTVNTCAWWRQNKVCVQAKIYTAHF